MENLCHCIIIFSFSALILPENYFISRNECHFCAAHTSEQSHLVLFNFIENDPPQSNTCRTTEKRARKTSKWKSLNSFECSSSCENGQQEKMSLAHIFCGPTKHEFALKIVHWKLYFRHYSAIKLINEAKKHTELISLHLAFVHLLLNGTEEKYDYISLLSFR